MSVNFDIKEKIELLALNHLEEVFGGDLLSKGKLPINPQIVANKLGIEVKFVSFENKGVSGAFKRSSSIIYVNAFESVVRQRFTMAHELGHFVLHQQKEDDILYRLDNFIDADGKSEKDKNIEIEANCFAAALLMPKNVVALLNDLKFKLEEMATYCGVSSSAMKFRLINLGYGQKY